MLFLAASEIEHFVCIFEEGGGFCFGLGDVGGRCKDGRFRALRFTTKYHSLYKFAARKAAAHDLDDADIVNVEILRVFFGMTAGVASATK